MGLTMVAYGTSYLIKNPTSNKGRMMIILGAMKAGEGTLRYCPTKALMDSSIQNIMSQNGALGSNGNSTMQNMGTAMQNVGSTVQNMMSGSGSGLQDVVPEVGQLMKDFAGIGGTTSGNQQANSSGNQQANSGGNNQSKTNASGNSGVYGSTANNNANGNGNTNKNTNGKANNNSTNGNKNNTAAINPS